MTTPTPSTPSIYTTTHTHSSKHRQELEGSARCGCYFCFRTFAPAEIKTWVDAKQTALCPFCGIDSVLGDAACQIGDRFLRRMHQHHFLQRSR
jgi:hypothetical protein